MITAKMPGVNTPCRKRQKRSCPKLPAVAASRVGTASRNAAGTITRFRPKQSATKPAKGAVRATASVDAVTTRLIRAGETPNALASIGSIGCAAKSARNAQKPAKTTATVRCGIKLIMPQNSDDFYRIQKLPPYVFAVINEMRAKARAAQIDVIDLGMGNPDGATPRVIVNKMIEAARNARNHRYSQSRGIPKLREAITRRYLANYGVELAPDREAIVTIGAKDALAHLLFATVGPDDVVVSPDPAYPIHQYGVLMAEGHACMLPMPDAATFLSRLEELYRTSSRKPKLLLISFPHNPTTTCVDLDFFKEIIRLAQQHGTLVIHDFAYADLGFDGYKPP